MAEEDVLPCAEKLRFSTRKEAEASAAAIEHQRGIKLSAYQCKYCGLWHLSSR